MSDAATFAAEHHQRAVLVHLDGIHGTTLADEFPFGCDTIQHVAEALIALRAERRYTVAEARARVVEACLDLWLEDVLTRAFPDEAKPDGD
jgi:hypothetical protein